MHQRCSNPKQKAFKHYGGRGIKVCDRWKIFENFFADMGLPPPGHSIERRENSGDYEPNNCIWIKREKQAHNKRNTIYLKVNGEDICLTEAARRFGLSASTVLHRHNRGWPVERVLGLVT